MERPKYTLITGHLARKSLERCTSQISGVNINILELNHSVAALMSTDFIADNVASNYGKTYAKNETILIPGLARGRLDPIIEAAGCSVLRGPDDLWDLPRFLNVAAEAPASTDSKMQILAEIVDATRLSVKQILNRATYYRDNGADIIDLGGDTKEPFPNVKEVIRVLKSEGFRVSMDSHLREDILAAGASSVDMILSLTSGNLELAKMLDCPVAVIPDDGESLDSLYSNIDKLTSWNVPFVVDPILPPPCMGLAAGIERYIKVRRDFPDCRLLMGLGNITEMIDADSVGVNALLAVIAEELSVNYVLTTEVSQRAVGSVKEVALARNLAQKALSQGRVPKHIDERLLVVKESAASAYCEQDFQQMKDLVNDQSYRIFVAGQIYCFNCDVFLQGQYAAEIYAQLNIENPSHAFYLGRELERTETALMLKKKYIQAHPLRWGYMG